LLQPGQPRNVADIRACVIEQIRLSTYGVKAHVAALSTKSGTKDKIAQYWIDILLAKSNEMQERFPDKPVDEISTELLEWLGSQTSKPYNPLLDMPCKFLFPLCRDVLLNFTDMDISQETLCEILHTILLGVEKYVWHGLHTSWTPVQQDLFAVRLQSTNTDGLLIPPIRAAYMMQYKNGLIGKHFKTLMQTMVFHVQDIVTPHQLSLIRAMGELGAVVWASSIPDMDEYLVRVQKSLTRRL
jgi:hypothetical protein